ncbi:MAG: hypothetical protein K2M95_00380 [Clostridiales bacterium]|nr:hypothetical protein [Clostridiales bacterium]
MKILLDNGSTEFRLEADRIAIRNRFMNFKRDCLFCEGDEERITKYIKKFMRGKFKEVTSVASTECDLHIIFCPKGAKEIRELGEEIGTKHFITVNGKNVFIDPEYRDDTIRLEVDMWVASEACGQFWVAQLNEKETIDFCTQWLAEMDDED